MNPIITPCITADRFASAGVVGIVKVIEAWGTIGSNVRNSSWNMAQQATSIVCCCVPIYNNLLSTIKGKRRATYTARNGDAGWTLRERNRTLRFTTKGAEDNWLSSQRELVWIANQEIATQGDYQLKNPVTHKSLEVESP